MMLVALTVLAITFYTRPLDGYERGSPTPVVIVAALMIYVCGCASMGFQPAPLALAPIAELEGRTFE